MNLFAISGLLIGISSLFFGIFVYLKNRKSKVNQVFLIFSISVAIWGLGGMRFSLIPEGEKESVLLWWRLVYIGIIFIPTLFYHFVYVFLELKKKTILYLTYLFSFFFLILEWTPWADLFYGLDNISWLFNSFYWIYPLTPLFSFFIFSWFAIVFYGHYELYKALKKSSDLILRNQIKYFFLAAAVGFSGGGTCFLPNFGINLYPIFNFTVPLYPVIMAFAILKYHLFEIKVLLTEFLVGIMGIVLLVLPFVIKTTLSMKILMAGVFLLFCFIGYLLIRYTHREARQKEILEEKVKERTKELEKSKDEIQKAYEEIKKRKEELERILKAVVGRELRMVELKKRIKELEEKLKSK